jgi:hypothetical protein
MLCMPSWFGTFAMTFLHGYLLAGLGLLAIPVVVHLLTRQQPRTLPFPAFRFLKLRQNQSRRRLRLQHLLLLLLRMAVLAAIVLALARPQLAGQRFSFGKGNPLAAVLVFDTSPSMEYVPGKETLLESARQRAIEVLQDVAPESPVAVLDTGDEPRSGPAGDEWLTNRALVLARIDGLRIRPVRTGLLRQVQRASELLLQDAETSNRPRFLFVFSDRARTSWDAGEIKRTVLPEGVNAVFVDVGVEEPFDLAIDRVDVHPMAVPPGGRFEVRVRVRATGTRYNTPLLCQLQQEPDPARAPDRQLVDLAPGQSREYVFERNAPNLPEGVTEIPQQVVVTLGSDDALAGNNSRYATFLVRQPRKVLVIAEKPSVARYWVFPLESVAEERPADAFTAEVVKPDDAAKLAQDKLQGYAVICLAQVPQPPPGLWAKLRGYVEAGGGLILAPGGEEMKIPAAWNTEAPRDFLPAKLQIIIKVPAAESGVPWAKFETSHPLTAPFNQWSKTASADFADERLKPRANAYWQVDASGNEDGVIARYDDDKDPKKQRPALVEKRTGKGKVILLTLPLDGRKLDPIRPWHNYWRDSSFGLTLVDLICRYLAGDVIIPDRNHTCGQEVQVPVPSPAPQPPYVLQGPQLSDAETRVKSQEPGSDKQLPRLTLTQAVAAGNYLLRDGNDQVFAGFSLNFPVEESRLERLSVEEVEEVLGKGSVLAVGRTVDLRKLLEESGSSPLDLLPLLLVALLLVLTVESFLANRFYRQKTPVPESPSSASAEQPAAAAPEGGTA